MISSKFLLFPCINKLRSVLGNAARSLSPQALLAAAHKGQPLLLGLPSPHLEGSCPESSLLNENKPSITRHKNETEGYQTANINTPTDLLPL